MLVPVFANGKKSEEDFLFLQKKKKAKRENSIQRFVLQQAGTVAAYTLSHKSGIAMLLYTKLHSASGRHSYELCLWHLCLMSTYFVCPLARCVLRYLLLRV